MLSVLIVKIGQTECILRHIIKELLLGFQIVLHRFVIVEVIAEDMRKTLSIADRKEAIRTACMLAEKGDVILVAGKGHENYQEIKGVKHHFDDKEILKEIFK